MFANVHFLIVAIVAIVLLTLLLVTGNTMAISVRERTFDLAVLKAIGFSDFLLLALVLAESLIMASAGGGLGLFLASLAMPVCAKAVSSIIPNLVLAPRVILFGLATAMFVGVLSGLLPGLGVMRLRVVNALRRV